MSISLRKNIRYYYGYNLFSNLLILGPIMTIYFFSKGLSFAEIMLLSSIASVTIVICEVPTGAVADKIGRKASMLLGALLWASSLLLFVFGQNFYVFAIAEIFFGIGSTFKSGADVALIYDSLKAEGQEHRFQEIEGKAKSYLLYAQAVGSIAASFLYRINRELPMVASSIFVFISVLIGLKLVEPPIENKKGKYGEKYLKQIKDSGMYVMKHDKVRAIILYSMMFYVFYRFGFFLFQPYFEGVDVPVELFGLIFFFFNIVAAKVSKNAHKIMKATKGKTLILLSVFMVVSFILMGLSKWWIGVLPMMLQQVARGLYHPAVRKHLNKNIPSDKRATILSFFSLLTNLAGAIFLPILGLLKDKTDIFTFHLSLGISMLVLTFVFAIYLNKKLGKNKSLNKLSA
ncbi:MFS transporter [Oceanirhabdus sp. W0125-5]|uniref:MFS transporter n=1 Tax=Oceanirhabdus sp. W0125-5 TaxID=2999116 RepID=UPI0022F2B19A|nr:MFS transporter [Oceanirhabdus sp. W0125-5]WBW95188.1 MFS transporter [Oceanirhabdus sp. W0125-5]